MKKNNIADKKSLESAVQLAGLLRGHPELLYLKGVVADLLDLESRVADKKGLPHLRKAFTLAHQIDSEVDWEKVPERLRHYPPVRYSSKGYPINPYNGNGLSDYFIWPTVITKHEDKAINARWRIFLAESIDQLIRYVNRFSTLSHYQEWTNKTTKIHPLRLHRSTALTVSVALRFLVHAEYNAELSRFLTEYERLGFSRSLAFSLNSINFSESFRGRLSTITRMIDYMTDREPPSRIGGDVRARIATSTGAEGCVRVDFSRKADDFTEEEDATAETIGASLLMIAPEEMDDIFEIDSVITASERKRWKDPAYQIQHIARANLSLPFSRNFLQPFQLELVDVWIRNPDICPARRRLLAGMLLLGRSYSAVREARFALSTAPQDPAVEIELLVDVGCWRIRPELPDVKPSDDPHYLPITTSVCLPLLQEWREALLPDKVSDAVGKRLTENLNMQERGLHGMLRKIERGLRPTMIKQWLGRKLFLIDHTHNAAALITPFGAPHLSTLAHYEHPRLADLVSAYTRALQGLQACLPHPPTPIVTPLQDGDIRTGTPTASDPTQLENWISSTLEKLTSMSLKSSVDICRYSNEFVRFSLFMISANCLLRGVTNPDLQIIDRRRRLVVISDKDRGGRGAMSRMVPLSMDGLTQLDYLEQHRQMLRTLPGMPMVIDNTNWPILNWHGENQGARRSLHITAATTKDIVSVDFPGRLNGFRKFAHTRLGEAGIPGQYLDALCGHWHPGMEAYSQFSALNPRLMIETILPVLTDLMHELGFRPVRSRLA